MKYYFETDIDCKACLDIVLSGLISHSSGGLFFSDTDSGYIIVIDSNLDIKILRKIINNKDTVTVKIIKERTLNQVEYQNLILNFTPYTKSFW
ncbi:MAG: hypothetical protein WCV93_04970 [Candidatus Shapirobacteria bacterium]|jgi:hypothetical protein